MNAPQPSRHALLSPSSSAKWLRCPGSIALEQKIGAEDTSGPAARAGTFQHHVAAVCLTTNTDAAAHIGYQETVEGEDFTFDAEMAEKVQVYLDTVRNYAGTDGQLYVEVELDISWLTGEADAIGTSDAVIVRGDEVCVIDLKTGRTDVDASDNSQLAIYALAAIKAHNEGKLGTPVQFSAPVAADDFL